MEQKLGITSLLAPTGFAGKSGAGAASVQNQATPSPVLFGGMVLDANLKAVVRPEILAQGEGQKPFEVLRQQIMALSEETEKQLAEAVQEGDASKAVADVVAGAVSQIWHILADFDSDNGTTLVQDFSTNLVRDAAESGATPVSVAVFQPPTPASQEGLLVRPGQGLGGKPAQLAALSATLEPVKAPAVQGPLVNGVVKVPELAITPVSPIINSGQQVAVLEDRLIGGPQVPQAGGAGQTSGKLAVFDQVLTTLKQPGPISQNAALVAAIPAKPQSTRGIFALPANMQQFSAALSTTASVPNSGTVAQPAQALANGNTSDKLALAGIIAGIDVNAKAKVLLLASAKVVVSGGDSIVGVAEAGNSQPNLRADAQVLGPASKPEQPLPSNSFSKSIANQIQGEILNPGRTRIELAPRGLGSMIIDLQPKDTGGLQVLLRVENPVVLNALRMDREALLTVLANADVSLEDLSLDFQGFGQSEFAQDDESQGSLQVSGPMDEAEAPPEMGRTVSREGRARAGLLDFFT